jgi:hypothetical protein
MPRAANKTTIDVSRETRDLLKTRLAPGESMDALITRLLATPQGGIEATEKVKEAIALGADLDEMIVAGMDWAARQFIARKTYRDESGLDFATMTDAEIEAIPASEAKRLGGVTEQRIARTIARLEKWNQANAANLNMVIAIGPSFVSALREEIKLLTNGKIGAPNRNAIFAYFNQPGSAITPQDLPQRHNATTKAISHGIQALKDLIDGVVAPEMQHRYQSHLNHRAQA